jgi:predicted Rossmann fold flavoprotein
MTIAIIGGGAAGLMAAATILETAPTMRVLLLERNDGLGKKVLISGGGRCNVTTGIQDVRTVLTKYPRGGKFLSSAMYQFSPEDVFHWFEAHGVPLKIEEDLRVFPESDNGRDVVGVFERLLETNRADVFLQTFVKRIEKQENGYAIFVGTETEPLFADAVILTTGGQAYRHTGSTGDGYAFAQSLGHHLTTLAPSLNSFFTRETWPASVSGLSFSEATVTALRGRGFSFTGPILFTHKGITGPAVFAVSSQVAFESYDVNHPLLLQVDLFPRQTVAEIEEVFWRVAREQSKKALVNVLALFIPKSLAEIACELCGIAPEKRSADVSKKEAADFIAWIKGIPLTVIGRGAGDEFVTAGGVDLAEVNPTTLESKISPGLFFAGEILDIDGYTGGFNLQAAWATGRLAGMSAAEKLSSREIFSEV